MKTDKTHTILYAISDAPMWEEYTKKKELHLKLNPKRGKLTSQYMFANEGILRCNGIIEQRGQDFYDIKFSKELNTFGTTGEALLFLDYHLEHTINKRDLLERIENYFLRKHSPLRLKNESKIESISSWIREAKKELPKPKKVKEQKPKTGGILPGTAKRYKERFDYFEKLKPKHGHINALTLTAKHFSLDEKTIERAIEYCT